MALKPHERHVFGFLLRHLAAGSVGGLAFGVMLLWFDIGHLHTLISRSDAPLLWTSVFFFGLFTIFASLGMGVGIMGLGEDKN